MSDEESGHHGIADDLLNKAEHLLEETAKAADHSDEGEKAMALAIQGANAMTFQAVAHALLAIDYTLNSRPPRDAKPAPNISSWVKP